MLDRIDQHLRLARDMPYIPFGGLHVVFIGDLYQLPPPGGLPIFASKLWPLFELCELDGNQRAARDPAWAALLARVRVGQWTQEDIQTLESMVLKKYGNRKPAAGAVHLVATRRAVADGNRACLQECVESAHAEMLECPAVDISVNACTLLPPEKAWPLSEDTGGLEALLGLAVDMPVMLRKNMDVQDGLVNGARGVVQHIDVHESGEVQKIWVKFEKDAATYHEGVHARLDASVKQEGQAYVALSRSPTKDLCTLERFDPKSLRFNANAEWALLKLKAKQAQSTGPRKPALQELWQEVIRPTEDAAYYQGKLACATPPDWKAYAEEQRLKDLEVEEGKAGSLTCPKCGFVATDTTNYKKRGRVCPAKNKKSQRPKVAGKAKAKPAMKDSKSVPNKQPVHQLQLASFAPSDAEHGADNVDAELPFFQKQQEARCGMRALNNALGAAVFGPADMEAAAASYMQELEGIDEDRAEHIGPSGWYSVQVLYTALFAAGYTLDFHHPVHTMAEAQLSPAFVQNIDNWHWVAYRWDAHGDLYLLDSIERGPRLVTKEEFVESCGHRFTYAVQMVSGKLFQKRPKAQREVNRDATQTGEAWAKGVLESAKEVLQ
ncbi:ATP-dependent DNA helicase PIF1 (DNA repair and recombination helicase PIF1) (PIF1/RRM3 DNA helicase-like protein), partial [Durusdinium trenchii]